jgi:hypothetical protein
MVTRGTNRTKSASVGTIVLIVVFAFFGTGHAKIPEPDNIIYGIAGEEAVTVALKVNGELISSYEMGDIPDAGDFYVLRIRMDSLDPAEPGTARDGDLGEIFVNDGAVPAASVTLGGRGTVHRLDLAVINTDGDDLPDNWEWQIVFADPHDELTGVDQVISRDDFDRDGFSNLREFLSETSPIDIAEIPPCWADVFIDGDVDGNDLQIFIDEYTYNDCPCTCDMDGDGDVDADDMFFFCEDLGRIDCD